MSKVIEDRYASAIHSANLKSSEPTTYSDADVLGAVGLASRRQSVAMAACLQRILSGDSRQAGPMVRLMAELAWGKAAALKVKVRRQEADDIARAVLAWYRNGTCKSCGGHGFKLIPGTLTIGESECDVCRGTRKIPFDRHFRGDRLTLARWLLAEVEKCAATAGPAAMAKLAAQIP